MTTASALLRLPSVLAMTGLGRTKWLDLVKNRKAPQPIKLGRSVMWQHEEVQAWISERVRDHRGKASGTPQALMQPSTPAPKPPAVTRLLRTYDKVDTGSLEDMIYLAALNVEDAMLTGGLRPGTDYKALDLFTLGMPLALEMFGADADASYTLGGHIGHEPRD